MRNLKKVLALVLAMVMALSLAVTAGAAFNDQDKIVNDEAVDVCSTLGIINGRTDGSFDPAGNVTRAEMAKMICIVLNGGKEPTTATKATPTYADIDGHWAEGYIEYCSAKGVVAGVGGGNFAPNAGVTGSQAAKMLLVALGYNADVEKMVGANWELYTNVLANQDGLYEDLEAMDPSAALSRDNAAQMIYNTLNAKTINKTSTIDRVDGSIVDSYTKTNVDLLAAKFGAYNEAGVLTAVKWVEKEGKYKTEISGFTAFYTADDYSALIGQTVNVMFEGKATYATDGSFNSGKVDTLYGVYADDDNQLVTALYDDVTVVDADTLKYDGEEYELESTFVTIAPNGTVIDAADYAWQDYAEVTLIDNNNDDEYDYAVVDVFTVVKVSSLTAKKAYFDVVVSPIAGTKTIAGIDVDKLAAYEGMAKDDFALFTEAKYTVSGDNEVVKADAISGTVSGTKTDSFLMGGTWYKRANANVAVPSNGDELATVIVVGNYFFKTEGATGTADKLALVVGLGSKGFASDYYDVQLLLSDGTYTVAKAYVKAGTAKNSPADGTLYTYTANSDGYVLEAIANGDDIGMDTTAISGATYSSVTHKVGSARVAADAQVFVQYENTKGKLMTGAELDKWADGNYASTVAYTDDGVAKVVVIDRVAAALPGAPDDAIYGVVLTEAYTIEVDNDPYTVVDVWTADGLVEDATFEGDVTATLTKNALISFKLDGDYYVDATKTPANTASAIVAVTAVNGKYVNVKDTAGNVCEYKVDAEDTTILYIDSESGEGLTAGEIKEAAKFDNTKFYANSMIIIETPADTDGAFKALCVVVDVANMLQDANGDDIYVATP